MNLKIEQIRNSRENIINQFNTQLWGGYVNMLKTLESLFLSPKHWILEFIQNAEDANSKKFSIRLTENKLLIFNDGEPFNDIDVQSICDVKSRKKPSLGSRGYIGIGFKSIFRITNQVNIHSGPFHFKFDKEYWDSTKRRTTQLEEWPWEIIPIDIEPKNLPDNFKTGFCISLKKEKQQNFIMELEDFFKNSFPKESILLLNNIQEIEIKIPEESYIISKEIKVDEAINEVTNKKVIRIKKEKEQSDAEKEEIYILFQKDIDVPSNIRQDDETIRVRRSDIIKREIGIIFGINSAKDLEILIGKLSGVYSFLPVEGEQTGLPFGIFGDFIPQPGRDLINYTAKWNIWLCRELVIFFKDIIKNVISKHPQWKYFITNLLIELKETPFSPLGREFWEKNLKNPIAEFLESGQFYTDSDGNLKRLDDLIYIEDQIFDFIDKPQLQDVLDKRIVYDAIKEKLKPKIQKELRIHDVFFSSQILEKLKNNPEKLLILYEKLGSLSDYYINGRNGRDRPLSEKVFVLGKDEEFHTPNEIMGSIKSDLRKLPRLFNKIIPKDKTLLHPEIIKNDIAVRQLNRCGMTLMDTKTIIEKIHAFINQNFNQELISNNPRNIDDFIEGTIFLIATGDNININYLISENNSFKSPKELFVKNAPLNWYPLWKNNILSSYYPLHSNYFKKEFLRKYNLSIEQLLEWLRRIGVHGFGPKDDKDLIKKSGEKFVEQKLNANGHKIEDVSSTGGLGFDLICHHCNKVFEVKSMHEINDIILEESQVSAALEKEANFILVIVYNLPNNFPNVEYKEIPNPKNIWDPIEKAKIRRETWYNG